MATKTVYKLTGLVVLIVGALFFLRDLGVNYIGETSGWTILIVLLGAGLLAGDFELNRIRRLNDASMSIRRRSNISANKKAGNK